MKGLEDKLTIWKPIITKQQLWCQNVVALIDTETTGAKLINVDGSYNRILEIAILFYTSDAKNNKLEPLTDANQEHIKYVAPINFLVDELLVDSKPSITSIPQEMIDVHGITDEYLNALECKITTRKKLVCPERPFRYHLTFIKQLLTPAELKSQGLPITTVIHNARFDLDFLNHELSLVGEPPFEQWVLIVDSWLVARKILKKKDVTGYSLDALYEMYIKENKMSVPLQRDWHSAETDCLMLSCVMKLLYEKANKLNG